jgi:tetratricopeptide (TPR) repeat protein
MRAFSSKTTRIIVRVLLVLLVLGVGWAGWKYLLRPWLFPPSPLVFTPKVGLESLQARSLYYTSEARDWLRKLRPDLLAEDDRGEPGPRARGYAQATQDTDLFEALNGRYQFDTLLFLGDLSTYPNLLNHLLELEPEKRKFQLVYVDHWMMVFKRSADRAWRLEDLESVKSKMASLHADDRAKFLAKTGERILAIGHTEAAKQWMEQALAADGSSPDALAAMAGYFCVKRQWPEAEKFADKALEELKDFPPALQRKYMANVGTKHMIDAFKISERLLAIYPNNPALLLQHAYVAHSAKRSAAEIVALDRYIALANAAGRPAGEYEYALGMAYATLAMENKIGVDENVDRAAEHFRKALGSSSLTPDQRREAEHAVQKAAEEQRKRRK